MTTKSKFTLLALALCLSFAFSKVYSQSKTNPFKKVYGYLGGGSATSNGFSGELGIQTIFKNNWSATLSRQRITMNPKNLPGDYEQGYTVLIVLPIPDPLPEQELTTYNLTAGKFFQAGKKCWLTTEAGISIVSGDKFNFTKQETVNGGFLIYYSNSNYSTTQEKQTGFGGLLKVDFNWAFCSFAGLGFDTYANINSVQSSVGGNVKLVLGWMNRKSTNK